jgi:rhodanese-related sulfurtransferase
MKDKRLLVIALAIALPLLLVQAFSHLGRHSPAAPAIGKSVPTAFGTYTDLSPDELKPMLDNKDFFLVDTHIPAEGRLPKTDARIPYNEIEQQLEKFPADKNAKIVLACRSGGMSSEASQTMVRLGYTNVYNLAGGMVAWQAAGYEIVPESDW